MRSPGGGAARARVSKRRAQGCGRAECAANGYSRLHSFCPITTGGVEREEGAGSCGRGLGEIVRGGSCN